MWWVRPGLERFVRRQRASVPAGLRSDAECLVFEKAMTVNASWQGCLPLHRLDERPQAPRSRVGPCWAPPFPGGVRYLLQAKHEGSFYPIEHVERALAAIANLTEVAQQVASLEARPGYVYHCAGKNMSRDVFSAPFPLEEFFFQTWTANREEQVAHGRGVAHRVDLRLRSARATSDLPRRGPALPARGAAARRSARRPPYST